MQAYRVDEGAVVAKTDTDAPEDAANEDQGNGVFGSPLQDCTNAVGRSCNDHGPAGGHNPYVRQSAAESAGSK